MARDMILVNLERCTGCWSCSVGCKMVNGLADDDYRIKVRTLGNGDGIDHPEGTWPNLSMSWQPVWMSKCTSCAEGNTDHGMFCVYTCPSHALTCGAEAEAEAERLEGEGFQLFDLDEDELRSNVRYAYRYTDPNAANWEKIPMVEAEFVEEAEGGPTIDGTTIGELADNPATAPILQEFLPWLDLTSDMGSMAKGMTLAALAPLSQGLLTDDALAHIKERFAALSAPTVDGTTIGELSDDPRTAPILQEFLPWLDLNSEMGSMAKGMTLAALAPLSQGLLTDDALAQIKERFAALGGGPKFSTAESLIGDIADDPKGAEILAKYIPWLDVNSEQGAMAKGMTLAALAPFSQGLLTDDILVAIDADFQSM
ncbi:MAG: hypothetical protein ACOYIK_08830 [Coriobacteriales bacterium]|jgi:Fe-S-cluster-containing hydrogenase component 2